MHRTVILFVATCCVSSFFPAAALGGFGSSLVPQSEAREGVKTGRTIPLADIKKDLRRKYGGDMADAAMYSDGNGAYYYDVTWITRDGRRLLIRVDARDGRVLSSRGG